jgi:hypothetical protein
MTNFLALDKCLPRRPYLSIVHCPTQTPTTTTTEASESETTAEPTAEPEPTSEPTAETTPESEQEFSLEYDAEWLAILRKTHDWTSSHVGRPVTVSKEEIEEVRQRLGSLVVPSNFTATVPPLPLSEMNGRVPNPLPYPLGQMGNPQTDELLHMLGLDHCRSGLTVPYESYDNDNQLTVNHQDGRDGNEIDLDDDDEIDPRPSL